MGVEEVERIKKLCFQLKLHPEYLEHEPVVTSHDAAKTRGFGLKQGIKAILFTDGAGHWAIADVPADQRVSEKSVALAAGWAKNAIRMATPHEVMEITGCEVGAVPPFGHKTTVPLLVDRTIFDNEESAFNIGLRTSSARVKTFEMKKLFEKVGVIEGNFIKEKV